MDTSFTILNVWLQHRDQKHQKPPYTNFEHNFSFPFTLNCDIVSAIFNFESPIRKSWSVTSLTLLYCFWVKSKLPSIFYRHFEFRKSDGKILSATSKNPYTLISMKTEDFFEFLAVLLNPSFTILNVWLLHRDQKVQKPP